MSAFPIQFISNCFAKSAVSAAWIWLIAANREQKTKNKLFSYSTSG
jgi:hypothetical protein